jgi:hypothetical protein
MRLVATHDGPRARSDGAESWASTRGAVELDLARGRRSISSAPPSLHGAVEAGACQRRRRSDEPSRERGAAGELLGRHADEIVRLQPRTNAERLAIAKDFAERFHDPIPLLVDPIENPPTRSTQGGPSGSTSSQTG